MQNIFSFQGGEKLAYFPTFKNCSLIAFHDFGAR
jgi:hypothetical protein